MCKEVAKSGSSGIGEFAELKFVKFNHASLCWDITVNGSKRPHHPPHQPARSSFTHQLHELNTTNSRRVHTHYWEILQDLTKSLTESQIASLPKPELRVAMESGLALFRVGCGVPSKGPRWQDGPCGSSNVAGCLKAVAHGLRHCAMAWLAGHTKRVMQIKKHTAFLLKKWGSTILLFPPS